MTVAHVAHAPRGAEPSARSRTVRPRLDGPAVVVVGTLLLLVGVGIVAGQVVGHLLAAGIDQLLDLIALGQSG